MKLPRFRAKLWMLVVLVALAALGFAAERTVRQVRAARANLAHHAMMETWDRGVLADDKKRLKEAEAKWDAGLEAATRELRSREAQLEAIRRNPAKSREQARLVLRAEHKVWVAEDWFRNRKLEIELIRRNIVDSQKVLDWRVRTRRKYERACRFPWPSVTPEPSPFFPEDEPESPPELPLIEALRPPASAPSPPAETEIPRLPAPDPPPDDTKPREP